MAAIAQSAAKEPERSSLPLADDSKYMDCLRIVNDIRERLATAGKPLDLHLPQCVMVGGQSAGKSSLLEAYSGVKLPHGVGTKTRCPTVIEMEPLGDEAGAVCFELDKEELTIDQLVGAIEDKQAEILAKVSGPPAAFSQTPIRVKAKTHFPQRITTVDMPGLIRAEDSGAAIVETMVREQVVSARSLILAVGEADLDDERQESFQLASAVDPDGSRTIRIYTMCDVTKGEESLVALRRRIHEAAEQLTCRDKTGSEFAAHFVIARPKGMASGWTEEAEMTEFRSFVRVSDADATSGVVGVAALRDRIEHLLKRVVLENLGLMLQEVVAKRADYETELLKIGRTPKTSNEVIHQAKHVLDNAFNDIGRQTHKLTQAFDKATQRLYRKHSEDRKAVERHIRDDMSALKIPWFCAEPAFLAQLQAIGDGYAGMVDQYVSGLMAAVRPLCKAAQVEAVSQAGGGKSFGAELGDQLRRKLDDVEEAVRTSLKELARRQCGFYSRNGHYMDDGAATDGDIKAKAAFLARLLPEGKAPTASDVEAALRAEQATRPPRDMVVQVVDRTMPDLEHVAKAQYKEFISAVNAEIKHALVEGLLDWARGLGGNAALHHSAEEGPLRALHRKNLIAWLQAMRDNEDALRALGVRHSVDLDATAHAASGAGGESAAATSDGAHVTAEEDFLALLEGDSKAVESGACVGHRDKEALEGAIIEMLLGLVDLDTESFNQGIQFSDLSKRLDVEPRESSAFLEAMESLAGKKVDYRLPSGVKVIFSHFAGGSNGLSIQKLARGGVRRMLPK